MSGNYGINAAQDELEKFGRHAASWWDESGPLATLHAINPLRSDYVARHAKLEGARVLDVGCGAGILCENLARRGAIVTGIDLAPASLGVAREHAAAGGLEIDYQSAAAEEIAARAPESFDVVTCMELLEHVPRPEDTIAACARAVRPGGAVFFSTINRNVRSFLHAIAGAEYVLRLLPRGTHDYLKLIRPAELGRAARAAGLEIRDLSGLQYNPLTRVYRLGSDVRVNYLIFAVRSEPG